MTGGRRATALTAALAAAAVLGVVAEGWAAVTYDASLGGGVEVNDNLHFDPETPAAEGRRQPVKETVFALEPGLQLAWNAERDLLRLQYGGRYSQFDGDEERDPQWRHDLTADLSWRRWAPFFLEAHEGRTRVPRAQQRDTAAEVDQIDENRVLVRSGFAWDLGPRGVAELAYHGELESYPGTEDADRVLRQLGEGLVRYRWSPLWQGELRVAYGPVDREVRSDYMEFRASAGATQRLSERLLLRYGLEWVREKDRQTGDGGAAVEPGGSVRSRLNKTASLGGDLDRGGSWLVAYRDSQQGLPEGDTLKTARVSADLTVRSRLGNSLRGEGWYESRAYRDSGREETAWGPLASGRWMIAAGAACDVAGSWTSTGIRQPGEADITDHTGRAAIGVILVLYGRMTLEAGYAYRENSSDDPLRSYTDNLLYALLTVHFQPLARGWLPASYASRLASAEVAPGQGGATGVDAAAGIGP